MRKDELQAKAARLRERADRIEADANRRADDGMGDHFLCGPGGAGPRRGRRPDVHRYAEDMREVARLRSEASSLESTARTTVFSDDLDGLNGLVSSLEQRVADLTGERRSAFEETFGKDVIRDVLASERRKLNAAKKRLAAASEVVA